MIIALQYCKVTREENKSAKSQSKWVLIQRKNIWLKEQIINRINDENMITKIMRSNCDKKDKWGKKWTGAELGLMSGSADSTKSHIIKCQKKTKILIWLHEQARVMVKKAK